MRTILLLAAAASMLVAPLSASAGSFSGGGFRSSPSFRSAPVRPSPSSYRSTPSYRTTPPKTSSSYTPAAKPAQRAPAGTRYGKPISHGGRTYSPVYQNNTLMWLVWYIVLTDGTRQEQRIDCTKPRNDQERQACQKARV